MKSFPYSLVCAAAVLLTSCGGGGSFKILGDEVTLEGAWQIQLGTGGPILDAAADTCGFAGIAQVAVEFLDKDDAGVLFPELTFPCSGGSFDTRPMAVLATDRFEIHWVALDAAGAEVSRGELIAADLRRETHYALPTATFVTEEGFAPFDSPTVSLNGRWQIDMGDGPVFANATSCEEAGIAEVAIDVLDVGGFIAMSSSALRFPCFQATFDTMDPVLAEGQYQAEWVAYDDAGAEVGRASPEPFDATGVTMVTLEGVVATGGTGTFDPRGTEVSLDGAWRINGTPASAASCSAAGIESVQLVVANDSGDEFRSATLTWPCGDGAFDTRPDRVLRNGVFRGKYVGNASNGDTVDETRLFPVEPGGGIHVTLPELSLGQRGTVELNLHWAMDTGDTTGTNCASAGVETMSFSLFDFTDFAVDAETDITCQDTVITANLPFGTYEMDVDAIGGVNAWQGICTGITLDAASVTRDCFVGMLP